MYLCYLLHLFVCCLSILQIWKALFWASCTWRTMCISCGCRWFIVGELKPWLVESGCCLHEIILVIVPFCWSYSGSCTTRVVLATRTPYLAFFAFLSHFMFKRWCNFRQFVSIIASLERNPWFTHFNASHIKLVSWTFCVEWWW